MPAPCRPVPEFFRNQPIARQAPYPRLARPGKLNRMEIHSLKLLVFEQEINAILAREKPGGTPVRDLAVRFLAEGVYIKGKYQALMPMPFETTWKVSVEKGQILAHLTELKVVGFGGAMLKGLLMDVIVESLQADGAVHAEGDRLWIDLDQFLAQRGFPARTNLTAVRCEVGRLLIESSQILS
jgi:hypothetical protein